jgi:hypothetical protein
LNSACRLATIGACGGAVCDDYVVDEVWRRRWVKLDPVEGEAPGNKREAGAHHSGPASGVWQTGGDTMASDGG